MLPGSVSGLFLIYKSIIIDFIFFKYYIVYMKYSEKLLLPPERSNEVRALGQQIGRLRKGRRLRQADAALRAGLSRPVAIRIEAGDPGRTIGQLLRYLEAVAPGVSLLGLLQANDPSLAALAEREATRRVRPPSAAEVRELDF
jgi:transcriptional regulator with XRE-family HTH domain